jgi:hypothetical protein
LCTVFFVGDVILEILFQTLGGVTTSGALAAAIPIASAGLCFLFFSYFFGFVHP